MEFSLLSSGPDERLASVSLWTLVIRQFTVLAVAVILELDAGGDSVGSNSRSSSS